MQKIWKESTTMQQDKPSYKQEGLSKPSSFSGQQTFQNFKYNKQLKMLMKGEREREDLVKRGLQFWLEGRLFFKTAKRKQKDIKTV